MIKGFSCTKCQKVYGPDYKSFTCESCGDVGILDVLYDYKAIGNHFTKLSLSKDKRLNLFRYLPLLPIKDDFIDKALQVGYTPLYRSNNIHNEIDVQKLYIKDDGLNPTASLKDRASVIAVLKCLEAKKDTICCSSTGNAASSLAGNAARMGLKTVIFVPKRAPIGKLTQLQVYGANVLSVNGDYSATYDMSKYAIDQYGYYNRNAAINPYLIEGKKTVALEIAEQLDFNMPDWVSISVGDGCTIGGVYKGFYDLLQLGFIKHIPKLLGVQAAGCSPLYKAFHNKTMPVPEEELTLADSISVGIPRNPIKALEAVRKSKGTYVEVTDEEILSSIALLGRTEGVFSEPASAASLAGVIEARKLGHISPDETVVIINTGNGLKDPANGRKAVGELTLIEPTTESVDDILNK